jgi:diguanylate cyclase (GGDEF)-like protein/PAS domain S-box-containing protein
MVGSPHFHSVKQNVTYSSATDQAREQHPSILQFYTHSTLFATKMELNSSPTIGGLAIQEALWPPAPTPIVIPPSLVAEGPVAREVADFVATIADPMEMAAVKLGVISSLYVALRAKHGPAASHSMRVAILASAWGVRNRVPENQLQLLEVAGLFHEIGKIGIPDRVLQKPDRLSENEQSMMSLHTQVGQEIVRAAGGSDELIQAIAGLGVRFDSTTKHPAQRQASLTSRLINIIDAFDSMTTRQVFRDPLSYEAAFTEIFQLAGSQFDPVLVRSFAEVVLDPNVDIHELVKHRWMSGLDSIGVSRLFELKGGTNQPVAAYSERPASALIQSLNDTFYRHMMDHIQDGVIFIDSEYRVLDWNSAAERMTGRSADSVFQQRWNPAFACLCNQEGFPISELDCPFLALMNSGEKIQRRLAIRQEGSAIVHVDLEVIPVLNDLGHLCGGAMILEDISETAVLEQKIVYLRERASQDQLTKVPNRGELNRQLPDFVAYHQRNNHPGSVIICDIDFFKRINDTFSHQAGDEALIMFASVLKDCCRETDFVARYGGEEFVMLCGECDFTEAKEIAENIRKRVKATPIPALRNASITASFGVSTVLAGDTPEAVLGRADQGLLIAKESGRDRVVGLGLETTSASQKKPAPQASSWLSWLAPSKCEAHRFELMTNVPHNVTLEKLKGFVNEFNANVVQVTHDSVIMDVDCRTAPIPQSRNERLGNFRISIKLMDVEVEANSRSNKIKTCTVLETEIMPTRGRDRRSETAVSQMLRLKTALQGWMVAIEMDDSVHASIVRRIKLEKDSRY